MELHAKEALDALASELRQADEASLTRRDAFVIAFADLDVRVSSHFPPAKLDDLPMGEIRRLEQHEYVFLDVITGRKRDASIALLELTPDDVPNPGFVAAAWAWVERVATAAEEGDEDATRELLRAREAWRSRLA